MLAAEKKRIEEASILANLNEYNLSSSWFLYGLTGIFVVWYFLDIQFIQGETHLFRFGFVVNLALVFLFKKQFSQRMLLLSYIELNLVLLFFLPILHQTDGYFYYFYVGSFSLAPVSMGIIPLWSPFWMSLAFSTHALIFGGYLAFFETQLDTPAKWATFFFYSTITLISFMAGMYRYATMVREIRLRAELKEANATKDKFFSIIAHDLRGPIGSISVLFNEMIGDDGIIDPKMLEAVRVSSRNTYAFLENLLTWARSQKGQLEYHPENFNAVLLILDIINLYSAQANQKGIELRFEPPEPMFAHADPSMITTVVRNLTGNALKFTPKGGSITFTLEKVENSLKFGVKDTGVGLNQEQQRKMFKPGEKVSSTPGTNSESGTGLGLVLCQEFTEKSGGRIGVESEKGKGCLFWFTVPAAQLAEKGSMDKHTLLKKIAGMKILVAEDNALHQETTTKVLQKLDLSFDIVENGAEALKKLYAGNYDLFLVDIDMPVKNGIETTRELRQSFPAKPWVVTLSSYSKKELDERATDFKFDGYLNKPLSSDGLLKVLEGLLSS